jgi:hypothetical protein
LLKFILSDHRVSCAIPADVQPGADEEENAEAGEPPWLDEGGREYVGAIGERLPALLSTVRSAVALRGTGWTLPEAVATR